MENVTQIQEVATILEEHGIEIVNLDTENNVLLVDQDSITTVIALTSDGRLRFRTEIVSLDTLENVEPSELTFDLLTLNAELDPVAVAIDNSGDSVKLLACTTLRVGSLQSCEVIAEYRGLIHGANAIVSLIKEHLGGE